jgi:DNA-binding transcriptional LysR family regulator
LIEERVDVAFRTAQLQKSSLVSRVIGESRRIVVASRSYLREHPGIRRPEDLRNHQCLIFAGAERPGIWMFEKRTVKMEVRVQGSLTFSTVDALQDAVLADLGVAVMPSWLWTREQLRNQVTQLLPDYQLPRRTIHALTTRRQGADSKVRRFVDHVTRAFLKRTRADIYG